ncbi:MAG TPA: FAD-binding protein [Streptosporangiaceae bacterium]|nr:FAD-binding protein [Streptosporangiaceae bacterium]
MADGWPRTWSRRSGESQVRPRFSGVLCQRRLYLPPGPGGVCDDLRSAAAGHGLTSCVDPATRDRCTLGGMIGNDSCGAHSVMGARPSTTCSTRPVTCDGTRLTAGPSLRLAASSGFRRRNRPL